MQKNKDKQAKHTENKLVVKKEQTNTKLKRKQAKSSSQKKDIDEQDSDGSGGAFEEFIDQQRDE